jgi:hypothetical protein
VRSGSSSSAAASKSPRGSAPRKSIMTGLEVLLADAWHCSCLGVKSSSCARISRTRRRTSPSAETFRRMGVARWQPWRLRVGRGFERALTSTRHGHILRRRRAQRVDALAVRELPLGALRLISRKSRAI